MRSAGACRGLHYVVVGSVSLLFDRLEQESWIGGEDGGAGVVVLPDSKRVFMRGVSVLVYDMEARHEATRNEPLEVIAACR